MLLFILLFILLLIRLAPNGGEGGKGGRQIAPGQNAIGLARKPVFMTLNRMEASEIKSQYSI